MYRETIFPIFGQSLDFQFKKIQQVLLILLVLGGIMLASNDCSPPPQQGSGDQKGINLGRKGPDHNDYDQSWIED